MSVADSGTWPDPSSVCVFCGSSAGTAGVTAENRASIASVESPAEVLGAIESYAVVPSEKWIDTNET